MGMIIIITSQPFMLCYEALDPLVSSIGLFLGTIQYKGFAIN